MNFGDASPQGVPRYGSLVQWDDPTQLPLGLASEVRNCRYTAQSVGTRWGFSNRLKIGAAGSLIAGLAALRYLAQDNSGTEYINLLAYTATDGNVWSAIPFQQASVTQLSTDALYALANLVRVPNLNPRIAQAFNRGYIAMGDLAEGVAPPMVFNPSEGTLDPASDLPFAAPWNPNYRYRVGHMVSPSTFETYGLPAAQGVWVATQTGHLYRCIAAGQSAGSGSQPVWPLGVNATIADNSVEWEEYTPTCGSGLPDPLAPTTPFTTVDLASPITAGATVFVCLTYVSAQGESINDVVTSKGALDTTKVLKFVNLTGGPVDLTVTIPPIPAAIAAGGPLGANGATGYNVYAYIVQGIPDATQYLDATYYAQIAGGPFVAGATATISGWPIGQTIPVVNTAIITTAGNVDTGLRWMIVLFETRTEYITGWTVSAPIPVRVTQTGLQVLAQSIPIGPYNCIRRICAFTVAGASSAGPYTYVDQADVESPGFNQPDIPITSTTINDNVTTTATFNFTDSYLPGASNVTNYLSRVQIPDCSDVYFSKSLQQVVYTGCLGYPSGHLVSDYADPEAIRVPGSNIQVSESDGDRTVAWREIRETQVSLKENSGFAIVPNSGDPSTWGTQRLWRGVGPVGAKAVADGEDDDNAYLIFAHRSGLYRTVGGPPQFIGRELKTVWDQINWAYGYLIVVENDQKRREIRISVPFGESTVRNKIITLSYYFGWSDPVIFAVRSGRLVPNVDGRKWSIDDILADDMVYVPQRQNVSNFSLDGVDLDEVMMLASADGALYTLTENQYYDEDYGGAHIGYFSKWQSVPGPNSTLMLNRLMGASCSAIGNGVCNVYALDEKMNLFALSNPARTWNLTAAESQRDFGALAAEASRFGVGFDNGGVAGAWFEMHASVLWVSPTFATRIG